MKSSSIDIRALYPYGTPMQSSTGAEVNRYKYGGKEFETAGGLNQYDFEVRTLIPQTCLFSTPDPKAGDYPGLNPYLYCAANPMKYIDPTGKAWRPLTDDSDVLTGFEWVDPTDSYDEDGNLLEGLYEQAIFFSNAGANGESFDPDSRFNIGTSIATVYKADGSTESFKACTYPSDIERYPTIPEGMYEGMVGLHKSDYKAVRMSDIGTINFSTSSIELGFVNPSQSNNTTKARGVNIHKAGIGNLTGLTKTGDAVSQACFLIDINNWNRFINCFNDNVRIGIINSRTLSDPTSVLRIHLSRSTSVKPSQF